MEETNGNMLYYMRTGEHELIGFTYNQETYYYQKNYQGDIIGIYNKEYKLIATYEYDSFGKVLSIKDNTGAFITDSNHIAIINPFRYRSYYYDSETKLYYLNSRYYNPEWGRFLNADGIIGTSESHLGYNLYTYCENNPINKSDPDGNLAGALGMSAGAAVVGTLILGGLYYVAKQTVDYLVKTAENIKNQVQTRTKTKEKNKKEEKKETTIYRWGGTNPSNLTPRKTDLDGLSFTTKIPIVKSVQTTIEAINSTGILYAFEDRPYHVSVRPVGGTMEDWIRQGPGSIWTGALKSVVVKWDFRNP